MRKIKIGIFSKPLDNWSSGSGHHLDELMKHVLDLNDKEGKPFEFTFIHYSLSDNPIYSRVREIIIPRFPIAAAFQLRKERFDILHYAPLTVFSPILFMDCLKTATVHGIEEELFPEGYTLVQRLHAKWVVPLYMKKMDGIATVSHTGKKYFSNHYDIDPAKIIITYNGLSQNYQHTSQTRAKIVLHISRYSKRKNPKTIIEGFSEFSKLLGDDGKEWKLICAGKGWNGEDAITQVKKAGIFNQYEAPGFISEEEAIRLLNTAYVFVFPSFAEGFGMPNVEAMACGCPVITSDIFAIPEVVGTAAVILKNVDDAEELGERLYELATNPELHNKYARLGMDRIKLFDWRKSANTIFNFWRDLSHPILTDTTH